MRKILTLQHRLNPLHVYCRFMDRGLSKGKSTLLCRCYEVLVFVWLSYLMKAFIHGYCYVRPSCSVREEMKKG